MATEVHPPMEAMLPTFVDAVAPGQAENELGTDDFDPGKHLVSMLLNSHCKGQKSAAAVRHYLRSTSSSCVIRAFISIRICYTDSWTVKSRHLNHLQRSIL